MREHWKPVVGYEGLYEVSDQGRVWSLRNEIVLRASPMNTYLGVTLFQGGKKRSHAVHTLVAEAFLGPRPPGHHVDHVRGKKIDNRARMLEYVTCAENHARAYRLGLRTNVRGVDHGNAKLNPEKVRTLRHLKASGMPQKAIAEQLGVSESLVSQILHGKGWRHVH